MANATESPNPYTPLALLHPALANQFEVSRYFYAATLGAYVWDIGLHLGDDYALLFKRKIRFPTVVYFLSKAFTLAFILTAFVGQVSSIKNCNAIEISLDVCFVLSQTATAMLFFLRVTAVWHPSKIAFAVFSILWIAVLGAGITVPLGVRSVHIVPSMQCLTTVVPGNTEASVIIPLINDTAIFLAINHRVLAHTILEDSSMTRLRLFFGGAGLSRLSEALLRSGQHFYLIAVAANITLIVVLKLPQLAPVSRGMLSIPALALTNAMACLVFRRIKFGLISSDGTLNIPISDFHATTNPGSLPLHSRRTDHTTAEFRTNITFPLDVHMQTAVDKFEDGAAASQEMYKPHRYLCNFELELK
ncbi:hypothetical protein MSAN_02382700 [Mycena sanguinolenta]|uniref:Uncharacterized protein n=1 Tax=Mycena sanguinolenta TaxID=230812 RepID=A0A8H6X4R1_9AGAR|nr:hypothetical protein MSAN_02382700 [Mycena sanguinolenta]